MARIEKTVFISYRRKDISWALAVYQYLTNLNYDVFFDYKSIPSGDFSQIIVSNIRARAHFLLILTPTALDRCNEPGDWLRREIETAVDEKRNIIPLFLEGFTFNSLPVAEKLTGKLKTISFYNGLDIPSGYFIEAMDRLSQRYLDIPLDTVIHPISVDVQKLVKEEQYAVNQVLEQKHIEITDLVKPAYEKSHEIQQDQVEYKSALDPRRGFVKRIPTTSRRLYGFGVAILLVILLGIAFLSIWKKSTEGSTKVPSATYPAGLYIIYTESSNPPENTGKVETKTPLPTKTSKVEEPTLTSKPPLILNSQNSKISEKDGMTLLYVPAGNFGMGSNSGNLDEKPVHEVFLDAFWIDQNEVTNGMYENCVDAGGCKAPVSAESHTHLNYFGNPEFNNYPVVYVDWDMANSYCEWVDRRLPTEAEWEKAARGEDERTYPWGNDQPNNNLLNYNGAVGDTTEVGEYPDGASPYGALDMAGNVWEWVADLYDSGYYYKTRSFNPPGPAIGEKHVLRGGSWHGTVDLIYSTLRRGYKPSHIDYYLGFRCAVSE